MRKQFLVWLGMGAIILPLKASDLTSALDSRKVCELSNGYIKATPGNEDEMAALVADVNAKRTSVYAGIAAKEGLDPATVAAESAQQEKAANPEKFCS